MSEQEPNALSLLAKVVGAVSEPVQTSFFRAVSLLLGGIAAVPAAKLRQLAQGIEDTTAARTLSANALASAAIEQALQDPAAVQAAAELYLPSIVRKAKNRIGVAEKAALHLPSEVAVAEQVAKEEQPAKSTVLNDDWMNVFQRLAEDASSERLQDMFGRILAGEVVRPGAFSLTTLRVVAELDQSLADDFLAAWALSTGTSVDYSPMWERGEWFVRWKRLNEAGLMAPSTTSIAPPPYKPTIGSFSLWTPMSVEEIWVNALCSEGASSSWKQIDFTRVGREIGSLVSGPNYEENIRSAAMRLPKHGLALVVLNVGERQEVLWSDPQAQEPTKP